MTGNDIVISLYECICANLTNNGLGSLAITTKLEDIEFHKSSQLINSPPKSLNLDDKYCLLFSIVMVDSKVSTALAIRLTRKKEKSHFFIRYFNFV